MARSPQLARVLRAWRLAQQCRTRNLRARDVLELEQSANARRWSRRDVLKAGVAAGAAAVTAPLAAPGALRAAAPRVAIVGAGLAGLACADRLQSKGVQAVVYEAASRLGGRCFSNRTLVRGMACENGGELVDTGHKAVLGYANEFGLTLESYVKKRGEERFWFFGRAWSDEEVVDEFRDVVAAMQPDLHAISGAATAADHNAADVTLDRTDLATYFATRTTGRPLIEAVLNEAYLAEYGRETWQQSALNFLGFMRLNRQSKFEPFGVSDERYHLLDGNDGIVRGLARKLRGPVVTGAALTRLAREASGRYLLYFNGSSRPETADAVVLAIPFTLLRKVVLDASLALSPPKLNAIATLGYGMNAKTMVAFEGRPWEELHGSGGGVYADLPNAQATWETNRARATRFGIITDYASGDRATALKTNKVQSQVASFLTDFDTVLPGAKSRAATSGGKYVAHLEHWPTNPWSLGSYTCYLTGQFTSVAGLEGQAAGPLKFAGEHADSFYSYQGFMEGACLSGIRAANEVLADVKAGVI
jgi:monoamine oxidase